MKVNREAFSLKLKQEAVGREALSHLLILEQLKEKDKYPYQIIQGIVSKFCSSYKPSTGVIYPSLYRLQEKGYVVKRNRYYHITDEGNRAFESQYEDYEKRIAEFWREKDFLKMYHESLKRLSRVIYQSDREFMETNKEKIVTILDNLAERIDNLQDI